MALNGLARYLFLSALISLMTIVYLSKNFANATQGHNDDLQVNLKEFNFNYDQLLDMKKDNINNILSKGLEAVSKSKFKRHLNSKDKVPIEEDLKEGLDNLTNYGFLNLNQILNYIFKLANETLFLNQQKIGALIFINTGFLFLYILGTVLIRIFFEELREIENQHMYDRVLNFLLFKVVFLGAIVETKNDEMILWVSWFAVIGFLRVFSMLCRDRCEYLAETASSPQIRYKILSFLVLIIICDIFWFSVSLNSFGSMLFLLIFECFTLLLDTLQTLIKYLIHVKDAFSPGIWEEKDVYLRKTEFYTDAAILIITLIHYIQIVFLHGITFTLIDAVLFLNIRSVFKSLRRKYILYKSYRSALSYMESRFPPASKEELNELGDNCPICLESMTSAQKLPCNHIFHGRCLRLWLESHQSCPTCRKQLDKSALDEQALLNSSNSRHIATSLNPSDNPSANGLLSNQNQATSPSLGLGWDRGLSVINGLNY